MPFLIKHKPCTGCFWRVFLTIVFILSVLTQRSNSCPLELPATSISINGHHLVVELALTTRSRACGLSNRSLLKEDYGMLFVYPKSDIRSFWMKDTRIPLSIAFLDDSHKIINIEIMSPNQIENRYLSRSPALYALEVNQGWFRLHGIKAGDQVEIKHPIDRTQAE